MEIEFVFRALRRNYLWLVGTIAVFVCLGVFYLSTAPKIYEARMVVAPASSLLTENGGSVGGGGLSLSSVLMGGVGGGRTPRYFSRFINLFSSISISSKLLDDEAVREKVFPNVWDAKTHKWRRKPSALGDLKASIKEFLNLPKWSPPTAMDMSRYLAKAVVIKRIAKSDLYEISFRHRDKNFALFMLKQVYSLLDAQLRHEYIERQADSIKYLNQTLSTATNSELRNSIASLYLQEVRRRMLASSEMPFSTDIIDPPIINDVPVSPKPAIVLGIAVFLGLATGLMVAVWRERKAAT